MKNFFIKYWSIIILILILFLGIFLRFYNLKLAPGWWPDEGVYLNIANNLLHGKAQMFAFSYPFIPHPPLFFLISALFIKYIGFSLLAIRSFTAILGIILIIVVYFIGKSLHRPLIGLAAAFLVAVMPETVILSRVALPYELFTVFSALFVYFLFQHINCKKNVYYFLLFLTAGLAVVTSYYAVVMIMFLIIYSIYSFIKKEIKLKTIGISIVIFFLPVLPYLIWGLIYVQPAFLHDILYIFSRHVESGEKIITPFLQSVLNVNFFFSFGLIGLLFLPKKVRFWTIIYFVFLLVLEYKFRQRFTWFSATYIFIFYLGAAAMLEKITELILESWSGNRSKEILKIFLLAVLVLILTFSSLLYITKKIVHHEWLETNFNKNEEESFSTGNDGYPVLEEAIDYINSHVNEDDTVLASAQYLWMIKAKPTDPILSYIYTDQATTNFPSDMRITGRFLYDPSYQKAKFLLEDKFTRMWFAYQPGIKEGVLDDIYKNWPKVFDESDFKIYQNPRIK